MKCLLSKYDLPVTLLMNANTKAETGIPVSMLLGSQSLSSRGSVLRTELMPTCPWPS